MALSASPSIFIISIFFLVMTINFTVSATGNPIVDNVVCKKTSNYTNCLNFLYSDSRTKDADEYTLAFISVGLAFSRATGTRDLITEMLKNGSNYKRPLQKCLSSYNDAVQCIISADNDLNSESFFDVPDQVEQASGDADHCEAAFKGIVSPSPLVNLNKDLNLLCEICSVVAKLFTGGQ